MKFASCLFLALTLLAGCTSIRSHVEPGRKLADRKHFFVVSNLNDNHSLDEKISRALQARGFVVEHGPLTMMPADTQTVVQYQDRWAWDFSDHMVYLQLALRDPQAIQPFATVSYQKQVALKTQLDQVVPDLVDELLKTVK